METKVITIGFNNKVEDKKPIEFFNLLLEDGSLTKTYEKPNEFEYIELVCLSYSSHFDLMFAYNDENNRSKGILFLGKFNDGIV